MSKICDVYTEMAERLDYLDLVVIMEALPVEHAETFRSVCQLKNDMDETAEDEGRAPEDRSQQRGAAYDRAMTNLNRLDDPDVKAFWGQVAADLD